MKHGLAFALGCLRNPRHVGAIAPASRSLARAIGREVAEGSPGTLVEVGAGTGAITRELVAVLAQSPDWQRLVVVERDEGFASLLRRTYTQAEVLTRCASEVDRLESVDPSRPVTLVSSLPLLSMPREVALRCERAMLTLIGAHPDSRLIQYTYAAPHLRPFHEIPPSWQWRRSASVWANLPPANVWVLERVPGSLTDLH